MPLGNVLATCTNPATVMLMPTNQDQLGSFAHAEYNNYKKNKCFCI